MNPRKLAAFLHPFKVKPKGIRVGNETPKGYSIPQLQQVFARYLGQATPQPQQPHDELLSEIFGSETDARALRIGGLPKPVSAGNVAVVSGSAGDTFTDMTRCEWPANPTPTDDDWEVVA
ncbi:MAG: DUF3631 domain-containing protein [Cyanobacteria bacterium REEB65]|nr:DUF3631 domain-containing protein [Cyanobacteria bacterium REEB65]